MSSKPLPENNEVLAYVAENSGELLRANWEMGEREGMKACRSCAHITRARDGLPETVSIGEAERLGREIASYLGEYLGVEVPAPDFLTLGEKLEADPRERALIASIARAGREAALDGKFLADVGGLALVTGDPVAIAASALAAGKYAAGTLRNYARGRILGSSLGTPVSYPGGWVWLGECNIKEAGLIIPEKIGRLAVYSNLETGDSDCIAAEGLAQRLAKIGSQGVRKVPEAIAFKCVGNRSEFGHIQTALEFARRAYVGDERIALDRASSAAVGAAYYTLIERKLLGEEKTWNPGSLREFYQGYFGT